MPQSRRSWLGSVFSAARFCRLVCLNARLSYNATKGPHHMSVSWCVVVVRMIVVVVIAIVVRGAVDACCMHCCRC